MSPLLAPPGGYPRVVYPIRDCPRGVYPTEGYLTGGYPKGGYPTGGYPTGVMQLSHTRLSHRRQEAIPEEIITLEGILGEGIPGRSSLLSATLRDGDKQNKSFAKSRARARTFPTSPTRRDKDRSFCLRPSTTTVPPSHSPFLIAKTSLPQNAVVHTAKMAMLSKMTRSHNMQMFSRLPKNGMYYEFWVSNLAVLRRCVLR